MSLPIRVLLHAVLNILLVWALAHWLDQYFFLVGGAAAYVLVGCVLTLLNLLVRPILDLLLLPLRLLASLLAFILANALFLWLTLALVHRMDGDVVTLTIDGGIGGWLVVAIALGIGNWVIRHLLHARRRTVVRTVREKPTTDNASS